MNNKKPTGFSFNGERIYVGMRFYTMISDDEYKILTFLKFNDRQSAQFLNEETGEVETLLSYTLEDRYTLLSDYIVKPMVFIKNKITGERDLLMGSLIQDFTKQQYDNPEDFHVICVKEVACYHFLTRTVFNNTVNNCIMEADSFTDKELDDLWQTYTFGMIAKRQFVIIDDKIDIQKCLEENDNKIPDRVIDDAEKDLGVYILSYEIYGYDASVDLDKVNMKYFIMYNNDRYYIVLYMIDTAREVAATAEAMRENTDVIEFMLGKS